MGKPAVRRRRRSFSFERFGLAAGFAGAVLFMVGGQVPYLGWVVPIGLLLLGAFMLAMGLAARR